MELTEVYRNDDFQLTGISVSRTGRLFVNFPRWSDRYLDAVVEVLPDGETKPFPDKQWNRWNLKPATAGKQFVCVQSVVVDQADMLWIVDAAAPLLASVVPGGPKLLQVDLKSNAVRRVFTFDSAVVKSDSYLNDIRIDVARKTAYLTDSGAGGLVIVNLETGDAHRALDGHPSVLVEQGLQVVVTASNCFKTESLRNSTPMGSRCPPTAPTYTTRQSPRKRSTASRPNSCAIRKRSRETLKPVWKKSRRRFRRTGFGWIRAQIFT